MALQVLTDSIEIVTDNFVTQQELNTHINDTSNPHGITKSTIGLDNVENKSSSTILNELTEDNVTTALGYVPSMSDLSNVDNNTFKAKVEASGFSSGTQVQILTWEETD